MQILALKLHLLQITLAPVHPQQVRIVTDYHSGFIFVNGQAGSCASSIDVPTVCAVDFL